jgi:exonuclease SbcD
VLAEISEIGASSDVDLVVVSGDLFDAAAPTAESEQIVYRALLSLAAVAPVVVVAGNHDNPRRLQAVAPLLELGRVRVASFVTAPERGGVIDDLVDDCKIAVVPWLSQRGVVSASDLMQKDAFEHAADFAGRVRQVVEALTESMTADTVNLIAGHLMVYGAETSGSERHAHVFGYAIPAAAFPGSLSYVALGHLHRQQKVPASAPVWYAGSPLQLDFGEAEDRKAVLVVDARPGLPAAIETVPLTSGRRLVRLRGTLEEVIADGSGLEEAYVKVELDEQGRAGLADAVREAIPGAVDVVLATTAGEAVQGERRPSRLGRDPRELFLEYLMARSVEDPPLVDLFAELLDQAHEA